MKKVLSTALFCTLSVLHGAGHNANLNHSNEDVRRLREGQDVNNAKIMNTGDFWHKNAANYKVLVGKKYNSVYISTMEKYFGNNPHTNNYNNNFYFLNRFIKR